MSTAPSMPKTYDLLSPDFDILQAIRTKLNELPIQLDIACIKRHQGRTKSWHELDLQAKINVLADRGQTDKI
jgi:hypothetical protein